MWEGGANLLAADKVREDIGSQMMKAARREQKQRAKTNKRHRANPLSDEQERQNSLAMPLFQLATGKLDKARELLDNGADPNFAAFVSAGTVALLGENAVEAVACRILQFGFQRGVDDKVRSRRSP